ncbi:MAG TPA: hypothetical protein VJN71_03855 [Nitrososphaerales archaeon]|nr:hypothetical protein [Nitrososphaerales archaeon]
MTRITSTHIGLALLLVIPGFINFFTPIYNYANPTLDGMPFFFWFQILLLAFTTIPYLAFSYIEKRRNLELPQERAMK